MSYFGERTFAIVPQVLHDGGQGLILYEEYDLRLSSVGSCLIFVVSIVLIDLLVPTNEQVYCFRKSLDSAENIETCQNPTVLLLQL